MSQADPGVVRLDLREAQTLRGALNAIDELITQSNDPPAGIFDPVRLEMARSLNDVLADRIDREITGEMRLDPTERETARQALGAIESLATGAAAQERLRTIGLNPNGTDMQEIDTLLGRIQSPRPEDLAGTDVRYRLYIQPLGDSLSPLKQYVYDTNVADAISEAEWADMVDTFVSGETNDLNWELTDCEYGLFALEQLAALLSQNTETSRTNRLRLRDVVKDRLNIFFGSFDTQSCFTANDRARLRLAANKAANSLERGYERKPMAVLLEIIYWTHYRSDSGLTNTDPTGF